MPCSLSLFHLYDGRSDALYSTLLFKINIKICPVHDLLQTSYLLQCILEILIRAIDMMTELQTHGQFVRIEFA